MNNVGERVVYHPFPFWKASPSIERLQSGIIKEL